MTAVEPLPDAGPPVDGSPVVDIEATRRRLTARQAEAVAVLVRAAEQETEEVGYDGLTVRGVARRAGVAPATAYSYFSSKDHLLAEVLWRRMEALPPVDTDLSVPVAKRVARTVRDMTPFAAESPALIDACTVALISTSPDVSHLRDRIGAQTHRRLTAALGPGVDPRVVRVLEAAYSGALLTAGTGHMSFLDVPAFVAEAATLLVDGSGGAG
ncbi:MAG TPA: helix-turn-helix domain-containing protein [Acidimicrobiales bacterium]